MSDDSAFDLHSDDGARRLLYLSAFLLFFMPYFQAFAGLWPIQMGSLQWRYQATGGLSAIMMLPFIGLCFGLAIARFSGHKGVARLIGVIAALHAVGLVLAMGLFVMDALQLKKIVRDAQMQQFNKGAFTASVTMLMSLVVFIVLTVIAFRGPQGVMKLSPPKTKMKNPTGEGAPGLLIGQDYQK